MKVEAARTYFKDVGKSLKSFSEPNSRSTTVVERREVMENFRRTPEYQDAFITLRTDSHIRRMLGKELPERSHATYRLLSDTLEPVVVFGDAATLDEGKNLTMCGTRMVNKYIEPLSLRLSNGQNKKVVRLIEKTNAGIDILNALDTLARTKEGNKKDFTTATGMAFDYFKIAVKLMTHGVYAKLQEIFETVDKSENVGLAIQTKEHSTTDLVNMHVQGMTLGKLFTMDFTSDNLVKAYSFLTSTSVNGFNLGEEQNPLPVDPVTPVDQEYPLFYQSTLRLLPQYVASLLQMRQSDIKTQAKLLNIPDDVTNYAEEMYTHLFKLRSKIVDLIFDPRSTSFPALRDILMQNLQKNSEFRDASLIVLNPGFKYVFSFLRQAKTLAQKDTSGNEAFYQFLVDSTYRYIEGMPDDILLTREDSFSFFENLSKEKALCGEAQSLDVGQFTKLYHAIRGKESREIYIIGSQLLGNIDLNGLLKPSRIMVRFPQDKVKIIGVDFVYINEEGEHQEISVEVDLKKSKIDWNFVEDFNDPDMSALSTSIYSAILSSLSFIDVVTTEGYSKKIEDAKQRNRTVRPSNTSSKVESIIINGLPEETHTEKVKTRPSISSPREVQAINILLEETQRSNGTIILEGNPIIQQGLDTLSSVDARSIQASLKSYNEQGKGSIKRLHFPAPDGTILYSRRVGHNRVLLRKNNAGDFEVLAIGRRADIYRKYRIET